MNNPDIVDTLPLLTPQQARKIWEREKQARYARMRECCNVAIRKASSERVVVPLLTDAPAAEVSALIDELHDAGWELVMRSSNPLLIEIQPAGSET